MNRDGSRPSSVDANEFLRSVENVGHGIQDPVAKLRFLRTSLYRYRAFRSVRSVRFAPARRVLYRWLSLEGLRDLLHRPNLRNARAPLSMGTHLSMAIGRAAVVGLGLIIGVGAGATVYR